ncbi:membrane dipeptidase [Sphingomonas sp. BGYR3]|uniref:dipeptidase n=1 Tax=Sphingomonas sp. BGYR3 TaxID=2975483 RepID=UPI0021A4362F|nr:membrane dipeptidase [Sphingomonas sp. BGYR3]MDG5488991.1 membrane dipeptidase [Sphingomonas sp. BGYR3]
MPPIRALALFLLAGTAVPLHAQDAPRVDRKAAALHQSILTLDSHLDTPASLDLPGWSILDEHEVHDDYTQVDLPRMKAGGLDGGLWAIYTPQGPLTPEGYQQSRNFAVMRGLSIHKMVAASPGDFALATKAADAAPIAKAGKRVVYLSMENAYPLGEDLSLIDLFQKMDVRVIGFTHFAHNQFGDSSTDPSKAPKWGGLSPLGKQLLAEMNRRGIVPDLSHSADSTLDDALALSTAPLILTHSGCKAIYDHPRNVDDARLKALAAKGGVIQMNAYGGYLRALKPNPERDAALRALREAMPRGEMTAAQRAEMLAKRREIDAKYPADEASFEDFLAHLFHALKLVGPDHVGIGLDWDGGGGTRGMQDIRALPRITEALVKAGYSEADIEKIWSGNMLRVLKAAEDAAAK